MTKTHNQSNTRWRNLEPGVSTFELVVSELGEPSDTMELKDGTVYGFCQNTVEATFLKDDPKLFRLKVSHKYTGTQAPPQTLGEALKQFPELEQEFSLSRRAHTWSARGITLCCNKHDADGSVLWIEFQSTAEE